VYAKRNRRRVELCGLDEEDQEEILDNAALERER